MAVILAARGSSRGGDGKGERKVKGRTVRREIWATENSEFTSGWL